MKIAIDLNDTYRAFTSTFAKQYQKNIDRKFNIDEVEIWTNELNEVFPFSSKSAYLDFMYEDCPYEIFGAASPTEKGLPARLNDWLEEIENEDEVPEICIVSTKEFGKSIGASLFFVSKYATKIREIQLLAKEDEVWGKCDVIITANPIILQNVPEGKIAIKILASYNEEIENEFEFESFMEFLCDGEIIKKITDKFNKLI